MTKICCQILKVVLGVGLGIWIFMAPILWILRDGLGPDMVESTGPQAVLKFIVGWGVPALVLALPLVVVVLIERRWQPQS